MNDILLKKAYENGHVMIIVSPDRYECTNCDTYIAKSLVDSTSWYSLGTSTICPDTRVVLTELGRYQTESSVSGHVHPNNSPNPKAGGPQ